MNCTDRFAVGDIITLDAGATVPKDLIGVKMRVTSVSESEIVIEIADKAEKERILAAVRKRMRCEWT